MKFCKIKDKALQDERSQIAEQNIRLCGERGKT